MVVVLEGMMILVLDVVVMVVVVEVSLVHLLLAEEEVFVS
jgi:hypothetical protein